MSWYSWDLDISSTLHPEPYALTPRRAVYSNQNTLVQSLGGLENSAAVYTFVKAVRVFKTLVHPELSLAFTGAYPRFWPSGFSIPRVLTC